jgi:hypothetical protein
VRQLEALQQRSDQPWVNEINVRVEAELGLWEPPGATREDMEIMPEQAAEWLEGEGSVEGPTTKLSSNATSS